MAAAAVNRVASEVAVGSMVEVVVGVVMTVAAPTAEAAMVLETVVG